MVVLPERITSAAYPVFIRFEPQPPKTEYIACLARPRYNKFLAQRDSAFERRPSFEMWDSSSFSPGINRRLQHACHTRKVWKSSLVLLLSCDACNPCGSRLVSAPVAEARCLCRTEALRSGIGRRQKDTPVRCPLRYDRYAVRGYAPHRAVLGSSSGDGVESLLQERSDLQALLEPLEAWIVGALSFAGSHLVFFLSAPLLLAVFFCSLSLSLLYSRSHPLSPCSVFFQNFSEVRDLKPARCVWLGQLTLALASSCPASQTLRPGTQKRPSF